MQVRTWRVGIFCIKKVFHSYEKNWIEGAWHFFVHFTAQGNKSCFLYHWGNFPSFTVVNVYLPESVSSAWGCSWNNRSRWAPPDSVAPYSPPSCWPQLMQPRPSQSTPAGSAGSPSGTRALAEARRQADALRYPPRSLAWSLPSGKWWPGTGSPGPSVGSCSRWPERGAAGSWPHQWLCELHHYTSLCCPRDLHQGSVEEASSSSGAAERTEGWDLCELPSQWGRRCWSAAARWQSADLLSPSCSLESAAAAWPSPYHDTCWKVRRRCAAAPARAFAEQQRRESQSRPSWPKPTGCWGEHPGSAPAHRWRGIHARSLEVGGPSDTAPAGAAAQPLCWPAALSRALTLPPVWLSTRCPLWSMSCLGAPAISASPGGSLKPLHVTLEPSVLKTLSQHHTRG